MHTGALADSYSFVARCSRLRWLMQPYVFGIPLDSRILVWQVIIIMCIFAGKCNTAMFKLTDSYIADDELFARVQKGDEKAFTIVYGRYNKLIYVLAYRYLLDKARAEDVVQYVFVKLWEYRRELHIGISLKNFLFTMAKNHVLNLIRNENAALEKAYEIAQQVPAYEDDLVEKLEKREQMSLFYRALSKLPPQKKEICLMKLRGDMSNQEIADRLHVSVNTVKSHYQEALKMLRRELLKLLMIVIVVVLWGCQSVN